MEKRPKEKIWLWADKVWERLKTHPVQGFTAIGPLPLEAVSENRLLLLEQIAIALAPNIPSNHWRIRQAWLALVLRHIGVKAMVACRKKFKQQGARYAKPERPRVHVTQEEARSRQRYWDRARRDAILSNDGVVRGDRHHTVDPNHRTTDYP